MIKNRKIKSLTRHLNKIYKEQIEPINKQIDEARKNLKICCLGNNYGKGCGKKTAIGKLTYIQTHWYTQPRGCTEGDYWNEGEGQFECPKCGHRNRIYEYDDRGEDWLTMKDYFKKVVDEYDK